MARWSMRKGSGWTEIGSRKENGKDKMKGKRVVLWSIISLLVMPAGDVHAEMQDPCGNLIDWDMDGSGEEDAAGDELDVDLMEAPTYDTEEQAGILSSLAETTTPAERGYLHIECDLGEGWPGYNVTLALYDERNKRQDVTIYSQNGYEAKELLPVGTYRVYRAYVPGDGEGERYPLVVSESQVTVGEEMSASLAIWRAEAIERKEGIMETEGQEDGGDSPRSVVADTVMTAVVIIGIILLIVGIVTAIQRWVDRR